MSARATATATSGGSRTSRAAGVAVVVVYLVGVAAWLALDHHLGLTDMSVASIGLLTGFTWFAALGGLIVARQPRNAMGWIFSAIALAVGCFPALNAFAALLAREGNPPWYAVAAAWPNTWYWLALLSLVLMFIPLLFPDGSPPSPRWRPVVWLATVFTVAICASGAFGPTIGVQNTDIAFDNPLHVPGIASLEHSPFMLLAAGGLILSALASVVVRFRRSTGVERQQLKWFLAALLPMPLLPVGDVLQQSAPEVAWLGGLSFLLVLNALPLAIGLAVLRYRLWDIDRIISRTLTWALLTATLGGLYLAGVLGLGAALRTLGGSSDLAVAGSTLAVAAAFRPLRRGTQHLVDRRFNRARYDAERTVEAYRSRLRATTQLDEVTTGLVSAVHTTVEPAAASVWLRTGTGGAR